MDPHPHANLFKLAAYCKPIAHNEVNKNAIGIHLLNEKHDCKCVSTNSMNVNCANDHDWGDDVSFDLENLFKPHDEYVIDNNVCNTIKSVFGRVSTLGNKDPTILENYKFFMQVDHREIIVYDSYIVEFVYDPTCNYYERGKYGYRNLHVTKLPLFMLRLLLFLSSSYA